MLKFAVGSWTENLYRPGSSSTTDEGVVADETEDEKQKTIDQDPNANLKDGEEIPRFEDKGVGTRFVSKFYTNVQRKRPPSTLAEAKLRSSLRTSAYRNQLHRTVNLIDSFLVETLPVRRW